MDDSERYRRIKKMSFLLLRSVKEGKKELMVLYDNKLLVVIGLLFFLAESVKNFYLGFNTFSLQQRLLLGDIIISEQDGKKDQRLFCLQLSINYLTAFLYLFTYFFNRQMVHSKRFQQLSKFLLVLKDDEYAEKFGVTREFANKFAREMDRQVRLTWILIVSYETLTLSFYMTSLIRAMSLEFVPKQILICSCSVILGSLGFSFYYTIAVQAYTFYITYLKLQNARASRLAEQLNRLARKSTYKKMLNHLAKLNTVLVEFETSYHFFERSLNMLLPSVILFISFFPSIVIVSGRLFTNRLFGLFLLNLTQILYPILKANESFQRQVS